MADNRNRLAPIARNVFAGLAAWALAFLLVAGARAETPAEFMRIAGERTFQSLGQDGISDAERRERFRAILTDTFDLPAIGRFVLGRYWRGLSEAQQAEYLKLFEDFVVLAYANRFKELGNKKFSVGLTQPVAEHETLVQSEIVDPKGPPIKVNWRVRSNSERHRVIDVQVEGVSMSITQRDEFASVIQTKGGKVDGLLAALREKTAAK
jgi:phospholipid transport system substrate-binding protein